MKYTTLGRTGLVVSRLALGCMRYGDPKWRPWVLPEEEARPRGGFAGPAPAAR